MFLQDPPHGLLPLQLLLPPQVEDQQSQQDEEEHHPTHCGCDGRTRPKQKEMVYNGSCSSKEALRKSCFNWERIVQKFPGKQNEADGSFLFVLAVKVSHPVLVSMGQPLSSITVQLNGETLGLR